MQSIRDKIVETTALLMTLQLLAQGTGFLKQILIAYQFGTSAAMDGYLVANTIVRLTLAWISLPIRQTFIPLFRYSLTRHGEPVAWANASLVFNNLALVLLCIVLAGGLFASFLVNLVAPGLTKGTGVLTTTLTQIALTSVVFVGMGEVLSQILFAYERFLLPGLGGSVNNLIVVLVLLCLSNTYGIYGLVTAVVVGAVFQFALQLPILWEKRKFYSFHLNLCHPEMVEMGKLSFPLLLSAGGTQVGLVTDRIFASLLPSGSLSALAFASRLLSAPTDLVLDALQQATFPHFTGLSAEKNFPTLSRQLFHYLRLVFFLTLPIAIGLMVIADVLVQVVYQRGAFDEVSVRLTSQSLMCYAIGFPAASLARILNRTFFSLKNTRIPAKLTFLRIGIKVLLSWVLIQPFAHLGIALAESFSQIIRMLFLFLFLPEQVKGQERRNTVTSLGHTLAASMVMGVVIFFVKEKIHGLFWVPLELATLVFLGVTLYGVLAFLFQGEEIQSLLKAITVLRARYLPDQS